MPLDVMILFLTNALVLFGVIVFTTRLFAPHHDCRVPRLLQPAYAYGRSVLLNPAGEAYIAELVDQFAEERE